MEEKKNVINHLNSLLTAEFTAINQYVIHSEMCQVWSKSQLNDIINNQKIDEMNYVSLLIQRITLLGGKPYVSKLKPTKICESVSEMILYIKENELDDILAYNEAIISAQKAGDWDTTDLLNKIVKAKKRYCDWVERQHMQTEMVGISDSIANQKDMPSCWF
jgi:bacterioferritin